MFVTKQAQLQFINNIPQTTLTDLSLTKIERDYSPQQPIFRQQFQYSPSNFMTGQVKGNQHKTIFQTINNQQQQQQQQQMKNTITVNQFQQSTTPTKQLNTSDIILSNIGNKVQDLSDEIQRLLAINDKLLKESQMWRQQFDQSVNEKTRLEDSLNVQRNEINKLKEKILEKESLLNQQQNQLQQSQTKQQQIRQKQSLYTINSQQNDMYLNSNSEEINASAKKTEYTDDSSQYQKRICELEQELEEWKNKFLEQEKIHNKEIALLKTNMNNSIVECEERLEDGFDENEDIKKKEKNNDDDNNEDDEVNSDQDVVELDEDEIRQQFEDWRRQNSQNNDDAENNNNSSIRNQKKEKSNKNKPQTKRFTANDSQNNLSPRKQQQNNSNKEDQDSQLTLLEKLQQDKVKLQNNIENLKLEIECYQIPEGEPDKLKASFQQIIEKLHRQFQEQERILKQQLEELKQENLKQNNLNKILQQEIITSQMEKINLLQDQKSLLNNPNYSQQMQQNIITPAVINQLFDSDEYFDEEEEQVASDNENGDVSISSCNQIRKQRNEILQKMSPTTILKGKVKYLENKNQHLEKELEDWKRELWNLEKKLYQEQQMKEQIQKDQLLSEEQEQQLLLQNQQQQQTQKINNNNNAHTNINQNNNNCNKNAAQKGKILAKRKSEDTLQLQSLSERNAMMKDVKNCKSPANNYQNTHNNNNTLEITQIGILKKPVVNALQGNNNNNGNQTSNNNNFKLTLTRQNNNNNKSQHEQQISNNNNTSTNMGNNKNQKTVNETTRQYRTVTYYSNQYVPQTTNLYHHQQANKF